MFLKNRNIISKIKRSKVTDYAALIKYALNSEFAICALIDSEQNLVRTCKTKILFASLAVRALTVALLSFSLKNKTVDHKISYIALKITKS